MSTIMDYGGEAQHSGAADRSAAPARRISAEFVGIYAIGITLLLAVFSQFAWLDRKFERVDARFERVESRFERVDARFERVDAGFGRLEARLEAKFEARFDRLDAKIDELGAELRSDIRDLRRGQASLDKRLAVVESHVLGLPTVSPTETRSEPAS